MEYDDMNKTELTKLARKYTKTESYHLTGVALRFAKWAYKRRRGSSVMPKFFSVLKKGKDNCFFYWDGSKLEPFSYTKAIRNQDDKGECKTRALQAFRWAIDSTIQPFRKKGMHVDHIIPFHIILSDFMLDKKIGFSDVDTYSDQWGRKLSDKKLARDFKEYHDSVAKLRVIKATDNLVKGATEDLAIYRYRLERGETYDKY